MGVVAVTRDGIADEGEAALSGVKYRALDAQHAFDVP